MIDKEIWMQEITKRLRDAFSDRLLFVGLQGSYLRGEATETSDFDVMIVLNTLAIDDLERDHHIVHAMPQPEKACGFICGKDELLHWPAYEIFQLSMGTKGYYGSLDALLPATERADIQQSVRIACANVYHAACHLYVFGEANAQVQELKTLYKSVFFILQLVEYLHSGQYYHTKQTLLPCLSGSETELLETSMHWDAACVRETPAVYFDRLIGWCQDILRG